MSQKIARISANGHQVPTILLFFSRDLERSQHHILCILCIRVLFVCLFLLKLFLQCNLQILSQSVFALCNSKQVRCLLSLDFANGVLTCICLFIITVLGISRETKTHSSVIIMNYTKNETKESYRVFLACIKDMNLKTISTSKYLFAYHQNNKENHAHWVSDIPDHVVESIAKTKAKLSHLMK